MDGQKSTGRYILLIRKILDPKARYFTAKKLNELWPDTTVATWRTRLDGDSAVVLLKSSNFVELNKFKSQIDGVCSEVEIVEQAKIGGMSVF